MNQPLPDELLDSSGKPTVNDIARVAGVSLATVDRVLNGRPGVRKVTIDRVQSAITELGFVRDRAATNLARGRYYRLLFILPESQNQFIVALEEKIGALKATLVSERTKVSIQRFKPFDPQELADVIRSVRASEFDGVAVFGPETPSVRDALKLLDSNGIATVALVSDIPSSQRGHYVGIDNVAAGKTAAQLMGKFLNPGDGEILVISGSRLARDHLERRLGFDEIMRRDHGQYSVLPSVEGLDDPDLLNELLPKMFDAHPRICGVYSSAAGNEGLIRFIDDHGLRGKLVVIAHELTSVSKHALLSGNFDAVISQDTGHLVRSAIRLLRAETDGSPIDRSQERIRIDIYLRENMFPDETTLD